MMKYLGTVIDSGILDGVDRMDYIRAFEGLNVIGQKIKENEIIFGEGEEIDKICIIDSGSVRSERVYPNGELHIIQVYDEGTMFGTETAVSRRKTAPVDYVCNEDSTIVFISLSNIRKSEFSRQIYEALMEQLASDNIKKMHKIEILAEKSLRKRIMMYLEVLRGKAGSDTVSVRMSREQMARYLCVNRSALSSELNRMKREELIDFEKDRFTIL